MLVTFLLGLTQDVASRADAMHTHVVCPEHGEQLHADAVERPAAARRESELRELTPQEHGEGCLLALFANTRTDQLLAAPPSIEEVVEWVADAAPPRSGAGVPFQRTRLEFAPKTSPPQA